LNGYISFLNKFNIGSPDHDKVFDEYIGPGEIHSIEIPTRVEEHLKGILGGAYTTSVILTGNAGDGKTRLCRKIHNIFGEPLLSWSEPVVTLTINADRNLCIVKDLSELPDSKIEQLLSDLQFQLQQEVPSTVYLIAANEGKLTKFLATQEKLEKLYVDVRDRLEEIKKNDDRLQILNLNNVCTSMYVKHALASMLDEEKWKSCSDCHCTNDCIIYFNKTRLLDSRVQKRLELLYQILDYTHTHVTIRDLLIHLAHMITGGLSCQDIFDGVETRQEELRNHVYYENCWGLTMTTDMCEKVEVIRHFKKFDVGNYSFYPLDDYILNGDTADGELLGSYHRLFGEKNLDMGRKRFLKERQLYFTESEGGEFNKFITNWLPKCRRKAFFELEDKDNVITLLPYRYLTMFLKLLTTKDRSFKDVVKEELVLALNRSFCCLPISDHQKLYITANYPGPEKNSIPVIKKKVDLANIYLSVQTNQEQTTDEIPSELKLVVDEGDSSKQVSIDLTLFEYLMRLKNGGTFNVLAEECSLKISSFRDQILDAKRYKDDEETIEFFSFNGSEYKIEKLFVAEGEIQ